MLIDLAYLKACNVVSSDEKIRYYLNGVCLQATREFGVIMVATDGHLLMAIRQTEYYDGDDIDIIIPSDIINKIKISKKITDADLTKIDDKRWSLEIDGVTTTFSPIDGVFPDWRRVVPKEYNGIAATFNPEYYGDFGKIAKFIGKSADCVSILHNDNGPAYVHFGDDVTGFGVIMPIRSSIHSNGFTKPDWA